MDALRAIAVVCVLLHHYLPGDWKLFHAFAPGPSAVRLFFVLSGFLITGILLRERQRREDSQQSQSPVRLASLLKKFYARRALRIMPPYYALLAIAYLANTEGVREQIVWYLTYTSNFLLGFQGNWSGYLTPMWSLAVEEQFYLIWPLLVLTLPRQWLKPGIVLMILAAPLSRWLFLQAGLNSIWMATSLVTNLDTLGIGALLALLNAEHLQRERRQDAESRRPRQYWFCNWGLWLGAPLFLILRAAKASQQSTDLMTALTYLTLAGCFAWVVQGAARGFGGWVGHLLEAKPLMAIGKLSYGIYLYHMIVIDLAFRVFYLPEPGSLLLRLPLYCGLTFVVSLVSWFGLEQPMAGLKRYFSYGRVASDHALVAQASIEVMPFSRPASSQVPNPLHAASHSSESEPNALGLGESEVSESGEDQTEVSEAEFNPAEFNPFEVSELDELFDPKAEEGQLPLQPNHSRLGKSR